MCWFTVNTLLTVLWCHPWQGFKGILFILSYIVNHRKSLWLRTVCAAIGSSPIGLILLPFTLLVDPVSHFAWKFRSTATLDCLQYNLLKNCSILHRISEQYQPILSKTHCLSRQYVIVPQGMIFAGAITKGLSQIEAWKLCKFQSFSYRFGTLATKQLFFFPSKRAAFLMISVTGITLKLENNTEIRKILE